MDDAIAKLEARVGQTINDLEVLKLLPRNASGDFKYWLRCKCGTEFSANAYNVANANTKSCGSKACRRSPYMTMPEETLIKSYTETASKLERMRAAFAARGLSLPSPETGRP